MNKTFLFVVAIVLSILFFQYDLSQHKVYVNLNIPTTLFSEDYLQNINFYRGGLASDLILLVLSGNQAAAITIGNNIFLSQMTTTTNIPLLAHELFHTKQYQDDGYIKFIVTYLKYYFTQGYLSVPYEQEAFKFQSLISNQTSE